MFIKFYAECDFNKFDWIKTKKANSMTVGLFVKSKKYKGSP